MFFDTIYIVVGGIDMNDTINEVFSLDFDKVNSYRFDDISNYLRSVKDSFKLETYFITMEDLLAKLRAFDTTGELLEIVYSSRSNGLE